MFAAFLKNFPKNIVRVFLGYNLLWYILAAAITYVLVISGFDWWYFESTRSEVLRSLSLPAAIIGFFVPIIVPVSVYIAGELQKSLTLQKTGAAMAQASFIALLVSSLLKAFTGRQQPEFFTYTSNLDVSREFHFGFLQHGVFWGWPSSHTAVAFAGAVTLILLYPRSILIRWVALLYALYIGLGVSVSIHWFSDFLAGAIIGTLVGVTVARSFMIDARGHRG
jgi:membrane-associated phospholipid phosphatase